MSIAPAVLSGGELSGTEFGQKLSMQQQEQFHGAMELWDDTANSQYLEVYRYYAALERQREADDPRPIPDASWTILWKTVTGRKSKIIWGDEANPVSVADVADGDEKEKEKEVMSAVGTESAGVNIITQEERDRAYRALRVASWQAVFYLITTDILGFSTASETFQEMGYAAGVLTYFFFYLLAIFAGQVIWKLYLNMDSSRYPVICYADLGERTFGRFMRHVFNILQSGQLFFNVALLINGNGEVLAQLLDFKYCFMGMCAVWFAMGAVGGQIQSLRHFSVFANCNIWLNIATMIMTIYGCAHYAPVPALSDHKHVGKIIKSAWVPSYTAGWYSQVGGVQLAIFAYGGAMIFPEFMAEMRRPHEFWKSLLFAQAFCFLAYMLFGLIVYSYQGQYSSVLPNLDFQNTGLILANNIIGLITIIIAAVLYGNIGVKVFYENVLRQYFKAPSMITTKGRIIFSGTVFGYWGLAWVIAVAIPSLNALITLVGALFILQFTYTFPPALALGYWMQLDAMKGDAQWRPGMPPGSNRIDTWKQKSRWARGFRRYWYVKVFLALMVVAALANCALGIYAGVKEAISGFHSGFDKPFSCHAPNAPLAS